MRFSGGLARVAVVLLLPRCSAVIDARTDVFAPGVMFYEAARNLGHRMFEAGSQGAHAIGERSPSASANAAAEE